MSICLFNWFHFFFFLFKALFHHLWINSSSIFIKNSNFIDGCLVAIFYLDNVSLRTIIPCNILGVQLFHVCHNSLVCRLDSITDFSCTGRCTHLFSFINYQALINFGRSLDLILVNDLQFINVLLVILIIIFILLSINRRC